MVQKSFFFLLCQAFCRLQLDPQHFVARLRPSACANSVFPHQHMILDTVRDKKDYLLDS